VGKMARRSGEALHQKSRAILPALSRPKIFRHTI